MATPTAAPATSYSSSQPTGQPQQQRQSSGPRRKISDYGRQLAEKQKAKREYGLREKQFRLYFEKAMKSTIETGQALFTQLEMRLDNVVFRSGLAKTRRQARQMVTHGLVRINDKSIGSPSYQISQGDVITLKKYDPFEYNKDAVLPNWISYDAKKKSATVTRLPKADDIVTDTNSQLIIEFYSR